MLFIGIDVGKHSHTCQLLIPPFSSQSLKDRALTVENSRTGFLSLLGRVCAVGPPDECAVLTERTGHYGAALEQFLQENGVTVYRIPADLTSKKHRQKSDVRDARTLVMLLYQQIGLGVPVLHKDQQVRRVVPDAPEIIVIRGLVQHRSELVRETTRRKNKLTAIADELFPELAVAYNDVNGDAALALRKRYPTPAQVAAATLDELLATRPFSRPGNAALAELHQLAATSIGTKNPDRLKVLLLEQKLLIAELELLDRHVSVLNAEIERAVSATRAGQILLSFIGIGATQAAVLLACIGSIDNFATIGDLRAYCGWSPHQRQTGTSYDTVTLTRGGNTLLKQTLYWIAMPAVRFDPSWKALYERLVPIKCRYDERTGTYRGKKKVLGRIAGQLIRVIYILLKRDADLLKSLQPGEEPPPPTLYTPTLHRIRTDRVESSVTTVLENKVTTDTLMSVATARARDTLATDTSDQAVVLHTVERASKE